MAVTVYGEFVEAWISPSDTTRVSGLFVEAWISQDESEAFMGYFKGNIDITVDIVESKQNDLGPSVLVHKIESATALSHGDAQGQSELVYSDTSTVTSGTPVSYDLAGSLASVLDGSTVTFSEIRGFIVKNNSTTSGQIIEVGGGSNAFVNWIGASGDTVKVPPGGKVVFDSPLYGYAVTAGTGDSLRLSSASGSPEFDIIIWGIA